MKWLIIVAALFCLASCASDGKKTHEVVPSCFDEGQPQDKVCKSQRTNEDGHVVITRCIGLENPEANPVLRGKCVEKICSDTQELDCKIRGEPLVLDQYKELATANLFAADEAEPAKAATKKQLDPLASADKATATAENSEENLVAHKMGELIPKEKLKAQQRATATKSKAKAKEIVVSGFKKVCVAKDDTSAPKILRGKCATRSCSSTKPNSCSYKGRKEMFQWVAKNKAKSSEQ